jgi:tellurite resistance protein
VTASHDGCRRSPVEGARGHANRRRHPRCDRALGELPSLRHREPAEIDARVHAAFDRLTADGLEGRLKALGAAALDDQTRRRTFTAAAVVQYADGQVTNAENEFLLDLADVLGLDDAKVNGIIAEIETELGIEPGALSER